MDGGRRAPGQEVPQGESFLTPVSGVPDVLLALNIESLELRLSNILFNFELSYLPFRRINTSDNTHDDRDDDSDSWNE